MFSPRVTHFVRVSIATVHTSTIRRLSLTCDCCAGEQSELLNAARFGMSCAQRRNIRYNPWALRKVTLALCFTPYFTFKSLMTDPQFQACVMLRVLNAVRHADVGIGLTYAQYCHDGLETLITRLMYRNQHFLASRISKLVRVAFMS